MTDTPRHVSLVEVADSCATLLPAVERELLQTMILSRQFDRRASMACRQSKAWFHISSAGHEALAAASYALAARDVVFPHYRDRALLIARGMNTAEMARDLLATARSHSGGRNMSAHFSHKPGNVFSIASPVASQCLPAVGMAWAARLAGVDSVALCSIGDASTRQGEFYEAVCFAVDRDLPAVFLVSDNGYGISTRTRNLAPVGKAVLSAPLVEMVDGSDAARVYAAVHHAVQRARSSGGPQILWCSLDRLHSHTSSDDQRIYRAPEELEALRDPIEILGRRLIDGGSMTEDELLDEFAAADKRIAAEMAAVSLEPAPDPRAIHAELFAPAVRGSRPRRETRNADSRQTMVDAVNSALRRAMESDSKVVVFGQDIEDPKGGVFGLTKGLSDRHRDRVFNSPLAEATQVGVAIGLAAVGWRPIVELQFIDFAGTAWSQISNQLATLRWRTRGAWTCPVVIYAPYGGYLPGGGIWHSQANEALFTHVPGLRVAVASNADDAEDFLLDASSAADPVLILLPKHLLRIRDEPCSDRSALPAGVCRVVMSGTDVTLVAWGNTVELASAAAKELKAEPISIELIDLRWLCPWDRTAVVESLGKTGRLVVVQEDNRTSSFGASLIEQILTDDASFACLLAPPRLVSRSDVHVPFHPELERAVLPSVQDVVDAVKSVLPGR